MNIRIRHFVGYFIGLITMLAATWIVAIPFKTERQVQVVTTGDETTEVPVDVAINALRLEALWGALAPLALAVALALIWWAATKADTTPQKAVSNIVAFFLGVLFASWLWSTHLLEGVAAEFAWRGFFASVVLIIGAIASWAYYRKMP